MQVGKINNLVKFTGNNDEQELNPRQEMYDKIVKTSELLDSFEKTMLEESDRKSPIAVAASVAVAGIRSFIKTGIATLSADAMFNSKLSKTFEKGLGKGSEKIALLKEFLSQLLNK